MARRNGSVESQAKEVTVQTHGKDKYSRTLADMLLPDGVNFNQELVQRGWGWWNRKHAPGDTVLEGLERKAREERKSLWANPQPVPPWEGGRGRISASGELSLRVR